MDFFKKLPPAFIISIKFIFKKMSDIRSLLKERILVLDGAMGTMIQRYKLTEADYRGERFKDWHKDVKGNNDLLSITQPEIIKAIHKEYLAAGADIIETNTFSSTRIAQADYDMQELAYELNVAAARCAREAINEFNSFHGGGSQEGAKIPPSGGGGAILPSPGGEGPGVRLIAGSIGPLNKTLSLSPDVNNPGYRAVSFDEVVAAYYEQIRGLVEGGVDVLLIETIFDTLNAKAAIFAAKKFFRENPGKEKEIMISGTITDASGRTLSGQTLEAFYISVAHAHPLSVGLNCALGAKEMRQHVAALSQIANCYVSAYPNAGLPNAMGEYDEQAAETAAFIEEWAKQGFVNIVGGCCGTTPEHIRAMAQAVRGVKPRKV